MTARVDYATFLDTYLTCPKALFPSRSPLPTPQSSLLSSAPTSQDDNQIPLPQSSSPLSSIPQDGNDLSLSEWILEDVKENGLYVGNAWRGVPPGTKDQLEKDFYGAVMSILQRISYLTSQRCNQNGIQNISGKWINTHGESLLSWSKGKIEKLRPDFIFAHNDASVKEPMWSRTISAIEFKKEHVADSEVDPQLGTYVSHIFAEQVDRLFVNAVTWRGWELQVYRFDRSGVVCLDQKINIHKNPEALIQVIASFSYLSPTNLGWDPTCKIWDRVSENPQPSYKLSQDIFKGRGVYDLPWVFEVGNKKFVAIKAVNDKRRLSIWGRSTFVVHVVTLPDWESKNKKAPVYILKQCWQRLPGLGPKPKTAELQNAGILSDQQNREKLSKEYDQIDEKPFEATVMSRAGWDHQIKASCMVQVHGKPATTFDPIRKKHAAKILNGPLQEKKTSSHAGTSLGATGTPTESRAASLLTAAPNGTVATPKSSAKSQLPQTMQNVESHQTLVERKLVRLVFDRPGWPLRRFMSKRELLVAVKMIVEELGVLYEAGVIHRDVSPSNLIISDAGKPGGHIIDFDHSKIAYERSEVTQPEVSENVKVMASDLLKNAYSARFYVLALEILWITDDRTPTPHDFQWPKKINPVFLFGNRTKGEGFFTGTYQYLSPHLKDAPFHHSCHDLDSLWWSVNEMPLRLAGPGEKERDLQGPLQNLLKEYYDDGPGKKSSFSAAKFNDIMAYYSDYFKDLIPLMTKWYQFVRIACEYEGYEHHHPHDILAKMIQEAIEGLNPATEEAYKEDAEKERKRREQDKADISEAISKQMTVGAWRSPPPATVHGRPAKRQRTSD